MWLAGEPGLRPTISFPRLLCRIGEIHDVAYPLFLIALGGGEVQDVVRVDVLFVEPIVVHGAVRLRVAENLQQTVAAAAGTGAQIRRV